MVEFTRESVRDVLRYWLEFEELFIPEWKPSGKNGSRSPNDLTTQNWPKLLENVYRFEAEEDKREARVGSGSGFQRGRYALRIMCQCHTGGYLLQGDDFQAQKPTRTYALGFLVTLKLNEDGMIDVGLSRDEEHLVINRTLLRELIRNQANTDSRKHTVGQKIDLLSGLLRDRLFTLWETLFDQNRFKEKSCPYLVGIFREMNLRVADVLWRTPTLAALMSECASVDLTPFDPETNLGDYKDPGELGIPHFSWRWLETNDQEEPEQLGPFFTEDLSWVLQKLEKGGSLSPCLARYLWSGKGQTLRSALEDATLMRTWLCGDFLSMGRWPSNPQHGLTLMQWAALANGRRLNPENPILAVNGPPGTGKTTLLKDLIADRMVERTFLLLQKDLDLNWYRFHEGKAPEPLECILDNSIVVVSSNNKAVENISKELPSIGAIHSLFRENLAYFKSICSEQNQWGPMCAVLGNSLNRSHFISTSLEPLMDHLAGLSDPYGLYYLKNALRKNPETNLFKWIDRWARRSEWEEVSNLLADTGNESTRRLRVLLEPAVCADDDSELKAWQAELVKDPMAFSLLEKGLTKIISYCSKHHRSRLLRQFHHVKEQFLNTYAEVKALWRLSEEVLESLAHKEKKEPRRGLNRLFGLRKKARQGTAVSEKLENLGADNFLDEILIHPKAWLCTAHENEADAESRLQRGMPWGTAKLNELRSRLFVQAMAVNQAVIEMSARSIRWGLESVRALLTNKLKSVDLRKEHSGLWSLYFLCFPVLSTTFASVQRQFSLMRKPGTIGFLLIDEAGQTLNYAPVGLLQRSRRAVVVGDPLQLEPVVTVRPESDQKLAEDFLGKDKVEAFEHLLVSNSSAQKLADLASILQGTIGDMKVGLPLRVHRRCDEPMFSIANDLAYHGQMIPGKALDASDSEWIACSGALKYEGKRYYNPKEIRVAEDLLGEQYQVNERSGEVFIITPFRLMADKLRAHFRKLAEGSDPFWAKQLPPLFHEKNIGTVHTFQGKEADTVILCLCANEKALGGIQFLNARPNLLNVAVTRARKKLYILGNLEAWQRSPYGKLLSERLKIRVEASSPRGMLEVQKAQQLREHSERLRALVDPQLKTQLEVSVAAYGPELLAFLLSSEPDLKQRLLLAPPEKRDWLRKTFEGQGTSESNRAHSLTESNSSEASETRIRRSGYDGS